MLFYSTTSTILRQEAKLAVKQRESAVGALCEWLKLNGYNLVKIMIENS